MSTAEYAIEMHRLNDQIEQDRSKAIMDGVVKLLSSLEEKEPAAPAAVEKKMVS